MLYPRVESDTINAIVPKYDKNSSCFPNINTNKHVMLANNITKIYTMIAGFKFPIFLPILHMILYAHMP